MTSQGSSDRKKLTGRALAAVIRDVARLYSGKEFGSPEIEAALIRLSRILRRYPQHELDELLDVLGPMPKTSSRSRSKAPRRPDPGYAALELDEVRALMESERSKDELLDLAHIRFGISRSKLMRERKEAILAAIKHAVRNEEALGILSQEARRAGSRRSN